jgi:hypothetical protein
MEKMTVNRVEYEEGCITNSKLLGLRVYSLGKSKACLLRMFWKLSNITCFELGKEV